MKSIITIMVVLVAAIFFVSCKPAEKAMTAEEFLKIENEVLATDLKPESKEAVVKKYGYTLKVFTDFEEKIEKDVSFRIDNTALEVTQPSYQLQVRSCDFRRKRDCDAKEAVEAKLLQHARVQHRRRAWGGTITQSRP